VIWRAARRFFTRALRAGTIPAEVTTDRAPAYRRLLDELIALSTAYRRALREQPGRSRSRPTESAAAADARTEASLVRTAILRRGMQVIVAGRPNPPVPR
jgi:transposase-like protein